MAPRGTAKGKAKAEGKAKAAGKAKGRGKGKAAKVDIPDSDSGMKSDTESSEDEGDSFFPQHEYNQHNLKKCVF